MDLIQSLQEIVHQFRTVDFLQFLQHVIGQYGYLALLIGTFLEGETILLVAGFLAHDGTLDISWCIAAAFVGSLSGDQAAFYVGRWKGRQFIEKRPAWKCRVERVHHMLERFHEVLILSFRFFYGLRNLTPFILGTTDISGLKFFFLNAIGAAVWSVVFGLTGYFFAKLVTDVLHDVLKDVHHLEMVFILVVAVVGVVVWLIRRHKRKKADAACLSGSKTEKSEGPSSGEDPRQ